MISYISIDLKKKADAIKVGYRIYVPEQKNKRNQKNWGKINLLLVSMSESNFEEHWSIKFIIDKPYI